MFKKTILPVMLAAVLLCSCAGETATLGRVSGLDALGNVSVISREEGSGTRSSFADLVDFAGSGSSSDDTVSTAVVVSDTDAVIEAVAADVAAVGYVSMGTALADGVKTLTVDGVRATSENIVKGDYTLRRPFCLVWSGELSSVAYDFMTYVMGKGQAIVGGSYVTVGKSESFLSDMSAGTVTVNGSTSAAPLLEELAAEYMQLNPNATIVITPSDSTSGINDAMQGLCDLGMASRELKDYEKELLDYRVIAYDGIAVIVNAQNPLDEVTTEELRELFTGEITAWDEINEKRG